MTIPNLISIARLILVPLVIWALINGWWGLAFGLFILAGVSDAVDGFIARHFNQQSALGTYLDPMADKALLVASFAVLGFLGNLPSWLAILVISRDVLIVAAVLLSYVMAQPVTVRPLKVSKATTAAQIVLVGLTLAEPAFDLRLEPLPFVLVVATAVLTAASAAAYLLEWIRHMTLPEQPGTGKTGE